MLLIGFGLAAGCAPTRPQVSGAGRSGPTRVAACSTVHKVARGETLYAISRKYGVEVSELARLNKVADASQIEVGQRLKIPPYTPAHVNTAMVRQPRSPAWCPTPSGKDFTWPVEGRVISIFGSRGGGRVNKGVDIQSVSGSEVRASRGGKVNFVHESLPGFGKTIIIDHGDGFASVYAYVAEILVQSGDPVSQRQVIARVGSTGRTEVPALHFEIRRNQKPQNPLHYLP